MATSSEPPDAVRAQMVAQHENHGAWATKEDWIKHRRLIGQLYEKQPLKEVMGYMASQHEFRATCVTQTVLMVVDLTNIL